MSESRVVIQRCESYSPSAVGRALEEALASLGGVTAFVKKGQRVLLKPNLLAPASADDAVTTHPVFIREVARLVMEAGGRPLIGDSPSFGSARQVAHRAGILDVADRLGLEVIEFTHPVRVTPEKRLFPGIPPTIDRAVLDADVVINLPKVKAHQQVVFTGAVKNMFGCMNGKRKALRHLLLGRNDIAFGRMLLEVYRTIAPALTIADGIVAMEGPGPRKGSPKPLGIIVAGQDGVAVDKVLGAVLGALEDPPYLKAAEKMGIRPTGLEDIEILGCSVKEVKSADFQFPVAYPIGFSPIRVVKSAAKDLLMRRML